MTDEELLRAGRGIGIVTLDAATLTACTRLWETGLMRRDDQLPYTFTTQPGVVPDDGDDDDGDEGDA